MNKQKHYINTVLSCYFVLIEGNELIVIHLKISY